MFVILSFDVYGIKGFLYLVYGHNSRPTSNFGESFNGRKSQIFNQMISNALWDLENVTGIVSVTFG